MCRAGTSGGLRVSSSGPKSVQRHTAARSPEASGMAKKGKQKQHHEQEDAGLPPAKMKRKEYEKEMRVLHGELVAMQEWVKATGAKICIVFEGRDTAGKG